MKPDDFKKLINEVSGLISKQAETTEINIKAHVTKEIKDSEERIKDELRAEIIVSRAEAKADNLHLLGILDKGTKSHERRLTNLEEKTETPNPHKN